MNYSLLLVFLADIRGHRCGAPLLYSIVFKVPPVVCSCVLHYSSYFCLSIIWNQSAQSPLTSSTRHRHPHNCCSVSSLFWTIFYKPWGWMCLNIPVEQGLLNYQDQPIWWVNSGHIQNPLNSLSAPL